KVLRSEISWASGTTLTVYPLQPDNPERSRRGPAAHVFKLRSRARALPILDESRGLIMYPRSRRPMDKQSFFPRNVGPHNTLTISTMGVGEADRRGVYSRTGNEWFRRQTFRDDTFSLVAVQEYHKEVEDIGYTRQEGYVKINFWLNGKHTTVLNG